VRAAAKNHAFTSVVTGPEQYDDFLAAVARGGTTLAERRRLAARAFERTAAYDTAIAWWMARHAELHVATGQPATPNAGGQDASDEPPLPMRLTLDLERRLFQIRLLSRYPDLGAADPITREQLEAIVSPISSGDLAERAAAFLGRLHGECFGDGGAIRGDLAWPVQR
jgi:hypothetical protein